MKRVLAVLVLGLLFGMVSTAADPPQTRIVCKSTECEYQEPADAVASITDSAVDKPYTILVYPGVYTKQITMKSYVGIVGLDESSTILVGTFGGSNNAVVIPPSVTGTSFRNLTIGGGRPFAFQSGGSPSTTSVTDCTVGLFAGTIQTSDSFDCWYDATSTGGHTIYATNVTLNVSADCIMPTPNSRFIGHNLTVFSSADGTNALIRPGVYNNGWTVDIDGITHVSSLTGGTDYLFYWPADITTGDTNPPVVNVRNVVWSVSTSGTSAATQACVNLNDAGPLSDVAHFTFSNIDCSLAGGSSQTLYGYRIANVSYLADYRLHVQGGSITRSGGHADSKDVSQNATASGFVFEMGSVRNAGSFSGTVSAIVYNP